MTSLHQPTHPVRFVTAASLFDGHDASINIMRRILQSQGAEVIHLGHNRSVEEVARAAVQEDVQGIAISSYQGGHMEYFTYLLEQLRERGVGDVKVFGGGGGVIVQSEIDELHRRGIAHIFSPQDGQRMGLVQMINSMIVACDVAPERDGHIDLQSLYAGSESALARAISVLEAGVATDHNLAELARAARSREIPVLGITGTGGSGKSSLTDELIRRFRLDQADKLRIAVIAIDPTRRRGGGALLGDRIRMNTLDSQNVFFRSLATRSANIQSATLPPCLDSVIVATKAWGADLVIVETPGIGQGDSAIVPHVDVPLYVMTPEFGASTQLEKIDMLDFAEVVVINKFERRGAEDALRDVRRTYARNREQFHVDIETMPVFGSVASRFNDDGVTALYLYIRDLLVARGLVISEGQLSSDEAVTSKVSSHIGVIVPTARQRYLAEIAEAVHRYHQVTAVQAGFARQHQQLLASAVMLEAAGHDAAPARRLADEIKLDRSVAALVDQWPARRELLAGADRPVKLSLSGTAIPKLSLPRFEDHGELVRWLFFVSAKLKLFGR